jgi:hypothetical protein
MIARGCTPQLLRPWYRSSKGHRSRKQLVGRLGCALLGMLQNSTDFPCSHGIREFQIFEPKPVHFEPVRIEGGHRGPPCIPRGEDRLRRADHGFLQPDGLSHRLDSVQRRQGRYHRQRRGDIDHEFFPLVQITRAFRGSAIYYESASVSFMAYCAQTRNDLLR